MGKSLVTGIDIGHHSIKAVVMKPAGELFELVSYTEVSTTSAIFSENHTFDHHSIVKKLKELKKQLPIMARNVVLSVPDNAVISKMLHIDSELDEREKEFAIYQVFGQQSPFPVEDLSLDYVKVEQETLQRVPTSTYQIYATRKEVIESRVDVVKKSGFKPLVMDTQAHGLLRIWQLATQLNVEKKNWLLVDIGLTQTSICIIPQSRPAYYKDLSFGTQSMDVTSKPELALNQNNEMNINDKSDEFISLLAERLTRQISLYGSVNQQQKIEGVWVTGGGACLLGMDEILSQGLGLPIEVLDPLSLLQGKYKKNKQSLEACTFSVAAGLAIRGLQWQRGAHVA
ncbi:MULTISPECIES: type IV pilus assembly protein PilM [Vibrio]|uniref:Type IV pilus assembly protein PilM n=1 Tax=Vibrio casei TaxID=673372 RepID=A0A368LKM9_9VIBR|nr:MULTISPECIES: type IV pilus assembly protein PilM [Vibrio]RCS72346.1 type IV pilus assembly protein PilM [Vibrio casei]SJN29599.1 Type IV pilus biogenesis protein PilM [Vibrio casei]HBV76128.1 type IV pilus assembly protein PilM [Vibrio sp.]